MKRALLVVGIVSLLAALPGAASAQTCSTAPVVGAGVHSIWSKKPLYLQDADTCSWYTTNSGTAVVTWKETGCTPVSVAPYSHFFHAVQYVAPCATCALVKYEFILNKVKWSDAYTIAGSWIVLKNGVAMTKDCQGAAYGLNLPVNDYFKLYCQPADVVTKCEWHFSAYINARYDY